MSTATIQCNKSTYVNSNNPDANYSTEQNIFFQQSNYQAYFGFDFGYYKYKYIRSVSLQTSVSVQGAPDPDAPTNFYFSQGGAITEPWSEGETTYNNRPDVDLISASIAYYTTYENVGAVKTNAVFPAPNTSGISSYLFDIEDNGCWLDLTQGPSGFAIGSSKSALYHPEISIVYSNIKYQTIPSGQINGYANPRNPVTLSWALTLSAAESIGTVAYPQARNINSGTIEWCLDGTSWDHSIPVSGIWNNTFQNIEYFSSYTVPANTFPIAPAIYWRVNADVTNAGDSFVMEVGTFSTQDNISSAQAISPINAYVDRNQPNVFSWQHIISTDTPPTKSELQYSTDQSQWLPLTTVTGSATQTTIPADTLPLGNLYWRVRTYNTDGEAGSWSDPAAIVVTGTTPTPQITTILPDARPVVAWSVSSQQAYQVQILQAGTVLVDSGESYGTNWRWTSPDYLFNGPYTAQVRVKSTNGRWSSWAQQDFVISAPPLPVPQATYTPKAGYLEISVSNLADYTAVFLLLDGNPIAKIEESPYLDWTAGVSGMYQVRGVNGQESFSDSPGTQAGCLIDKGCLLSKSSDLENPLSLFSRREEPVSYESDFGFIGTLLRFAGRTYPVAEFSEFDEESVSISFSATQVEDWLRAKSMIGSKETLLFRDKYGARLWGVFTELSASKDSISWDFSGTIRRVDYNEVVSYDY